MDKDCELCCKIKAIANQWSGHSSLLLLSNIRHKTAIFPVLQKLTHMQNSGPFAAYCYTHPKSGHQYFIKVMILMVFEWELIEMK